jgi:hypothetical protein
MRYGTLALETVLNRTQCTLQVSNILGNKVRNDMA